jgi:hypothetical protein
MRPGFAVAVAMVAGLTVGSASAQETRPGGGTPGPGAPGQHGHMPGGHAPGHHGQHEGHLMMCHHVPATGGAPAPLAMGPGMMGPGMLRGMTDLPADPKQAVRVLRFRADMLKAISEVLARHAAELEKGQ